MPARSAERPSSRRTWGAGRERRPGAVLSEPPADDPFEDEDEGQAEPPPPPEEPDHGGGKIAGLVMAGALVVVYLAAGARAQGGEAFRAGAANAARILDGQLWRTLTALTLHTDVSHLIANVVAGAFLATAVCRTLGGGLGALLIVVAGGAGNAINAAVRGAPHVSVGASTAVFGAIGLLSGLAFGRTRRLGRGRARAWLPLAAGLALLGMLGSDPRSDLGAHFWGFAAGIGLGALADGMLRPIPAPGTQRALAALAASMVVAAWWLALRA